MKILYFTFCIMDYSVCDQLFSYLKKNPKKCFKYFRKNVFLNSNTIFLDYATNSFNKVIFNK